MTKDFGEVTVDEDRSFSASVYFEEEGGPDDDTIPTTSARPGASAMTAAPVANVAPVAVAR